MSVTVYVALLPKLFDCDSSKWRYPNAALRFASFIGTYNSVRMCYSERLWIYIHSSMHCSSRVPCSFLCRLMWEFECEQFGNLSEFKTTIRIVCVSRNVK